MKLPFQKTPQTSPWSICFPLFSLLFHLGLFFFFIGAQGFQDPPEVKDEEIIAMVDLNDLPPQIKTPEPPLPALPPVISPAARSASTTTEASENEPAATTPEPILDPELDEALEDESDTASPSPIETAQNITIPLPPPEMAQNESEALVPEALAETEAPQQEMTSETTDASEALSEKVSSPEPEPEAPVASEVTAPEPPPAPTPPVEALPSARAVAKASEVQDPPKAEAPKKVVAAIKKPEPPPSPPRKPSKEKIKKSGLLGLLGNKKRQSFSKSPRFAKNLNRSKKKPQVNTSDANTVPRSDRRKIDQLKNKLLQSTQKRLMAKKSVRRKKKSQLKMVQGSGRNFGVISSAIAQEEWRLTHVYNRLLQRSPGLQGNLIIEFTISPEGKVIKSHVLTSSFANTHFEKALMQAIRLWTFPVAKEGETTILYPLAFSPAG